MRKSSQPSPAATDVAEQLGLRPGQSLELLQALHILTRDGKINQDSRRKLKQVNHLIQFIEPFIEPHLTRQSDTPFRLVDHGAGKSYLGFLLYDLFFKQNEHPAELYSIETRPELVASAEQLAQKLGFTGMRFVNLAVAEAMTSNALPAQVDIVTALHACNTATDDAIHFALHKRARTVVLVPCCQAEVANVLRQNKSAQLGKNVLTEMWRHPIHTREFGSQITNVLRCLALEAQGYQVTVTELVGWEHAIKNELIIARQIDQPNPRARTRLLELLDTFGLASLQTRFLIQ